MIFPSFEYKVPATIPISQTDRITKRFDETVSFRLPFLYSINELKDVHDMASRVVVFSLLMALLATVSFSSKLPIALAIGGGKVRHCLCSPYYTLIVSERPSTKELFLRKFSNFFGIFERRITVVSLLKCLFITYRNNNKKCSCQYD